MVETFLTCNGHLYETENHTVQQQKALPMQRDCATHHKYEIWPLKKVAMGE